MALEFTVVMKIPRAQIYRVALDRMCSSMIRGCQIRCGRSTTEELCAHLATVPTFCDVSEEARSRMLADLTTKIFVPGQVTESAPAHIYYSVSW